MYVVTSTPALIVIFLVVTVIYFLAGAIGILPGPAAIVAVVATGGALISIYWSRNKSLFVSAEDPAAKEVKSDLEAIIKSAGPSSDPDLIKPFEPPFPAPRRSGMIMAAVERDRAVKEEGVQPPSLQDGIRDLRSATLGKALERGPILDTRISDGVCEASTVEGRIADIIKCAGDDVVIDGHRVSEQDRERIVDALRAVENDYQSALTGYKFALGDRVTAKGTDGRKIAGTIHSRQSSRSYGVTFAIEGGGVLTMDQSEASLSHE